MNLSKRSIPWLLVAAGVLACTACQSDETPATLCGDLPGSWFADATGRTELKSSVEVKEGGATSLPFRVDAQHPFAASSIKCRVMDGDNEVVEFEAELRRAVDVEFVKSAIADSPPQYRFTAVGGNGRVLLAEPPDTLADTFWYCGSSVLTLTVKEFASDDKTRLIKQLTERIAERVGCTQPSTAGR